MRNNFRKTAIAALLAAAGWFNLSYAGEPKVSEPVSKVTPYLVNAAGEKVDGAALAESPYVLFYYSAHWCPPCRQFTPMLVDFYNENGGGEAFEIVFVSADRSEKDMYKYMNGVKMPWLAVNYDDVETSGVEAYSSAYIPYLAMFDKEGNQIVGVGEDVGGEFYVSPVTMLEELKKRL